MQEPQIRFKGFSDEWKESNLDKSMNGFDYGIGASSKKYDGVNKYLRITDIDDNNRTIKDESITSPNVDLSNKDNYILKNNDIVFARTGASTGKTYLFRKDDGKIYFAGFLIRAHCNSDSNAMFIYENTFTENYNNFVKVFSMRSGQPGINAKEFKIFSFCKPSLPEQTKIGEFFNHFDRLIELQSSKLEHLKRLKKGYLQKMFTNGDDVPRLRFKEFSDVWKSKRLKDVGKIVGGGTPSTSNKEYWGGDINWYSPNEITDLPFSYNSNRKITTAGLKHSSAKIHPINTILFTSRAGIGKMTIIKKEATTNQGFQSIEPNKDIDPYFIYSMQNALKKKAISLASGSTFLEISKKSMEKIKIMIPLKIEQKKIGLFFNKLDKIIELQTSKLEHLKQEKKAYLQKMFI